MAQPRKYPPERTLSEAKRWCDRQERCQTEVQRKLASWGVFGDEAGQIIATLITTGHINEERFAKAYASGKSRLKKWGWNKIAYQLKAIGVSAQNIASARAEVDPSESEEILILLLSRKLTSLRSQGKHYMYIRAALFRYAITKGYGAGQVNAAIDRILKGAG